MNIILFSELKANAILPASDSRYTHIKQVMRMGQGDHFYVGIFNGPRGMATIRMDEAAGFHLTVEWEAEIPKPIPVQLCVGLPRPQTARRVLFEAAVFGVRQLHFFVAEKGELSYRESKLWSRDEWQRHLQQGAEQAFNTWIPDVQHWNGLDEMLEHLDGSSAERIALDIYEGSERFSQSLRDSNNDACLCIGSERGWSPKERNVLRQHAFLLAHLGNRVLKTETACVAGLSILQGVRGEM